MKLFNNVLITFSTALLAVLGSFGSMSSAQAAAFSYIRIGDVDGFGYGQGYDKDGNKYKGAYGGDANINGRGTLLGVGDVLPDLNENGLFQTYQGDDFNNQSASEKANTSFSGTGSSFQDNGSSGSEFTDISLSTSYFDTIYGIKPLKDEKNVKSKERRLVELKRLEERVERKEAAIATLDGEITRLENITNPNQNQIENLASKKSRRDLLYKEINEGFEATEDQEAKDSLNTKIQNQKKLIKEKDGGIDQSQAAELESLSLDQLKRKKDVLTGEIDNLTADIETREAEKKAELGGKIPQATFTFDFSIGKNDIVKQDKMYLNMLFADYDVKTKVRDDNGQEILDENGKPIREDVEFEFTMADGVTKFRRTLKTQKNRQGQDGLIQAAFIELDFDQIFEEDGDNYNGKLTAKMLAPDEPYLAFDFAELSTKQISLDIEDVPEPTTMIGLLAFGAFGASSLLKRKKKQAH
ncbi:MAG: PEP-CTERM sorting domain-containing protein [Calothrix sp. MO_167.B12]|nr:PEP-CTERM sorting domain-containing protein [Calothrix sp. MO_167.B12]